MDKEPVFRKLKFGISDNNLIVNLSESNLACIFICFPELIRLFTFVLRKNVKNAY